MDVPFLDTESLWGSLVAFTLALPIAWNREQGRRRMGLRSFPPRGRRELRIASTAAAIWATGGVGAAVATPIRAHLEEANGG